METQMTIEDETKYLTVAQLAERLQISESTIYGWVDRDYHSVSHGRMICFVSIQLPSMLGWRQKQIASVKGNVRSMYVW